jgi:hypothetical protein
MAFAARSKMLSAARTLTAAGGCRIDHHFEECCGCCRGALLEPCDGLAKGEPSRSPISGIEFRLLHPAQQGCGPDTDCAGCVLGGSLRQQSSDRRLLLPSELCAVTSHAQLPCNSDPAERSMS